MPDPLKNTDVRRRQRLEKFKKAFTQVLSAAEQRDFTKLEQQGLIQAFEFTHELAWNTLKDFLESRGASNLYGSKDATREGFAKGLVEDGEVWMAMMQSRNQTTHTYNQETADKIAKAILFIYMEDF